MSVAIWVGRVVDGVNRCVDDRWWCVGPAGGSVKIFQIATTQQRLECAPYRRFCVGS